MDMPSALLANTLEVDKPAEQDCQGNTLPLGPPRQARIEKTTVAIAHTDEPIMNLAECEKIEMK